MKALKILFFVRGAAPSAAQYEEANALNGNVCFRNALVISAEATLEDCDAVAGDVPPTYKAKFPDAVDAIEARSQKLADLSKKVGDEPAPKKGKTAPKAAEPAPTPATAPAAAPAAPAAAPAKAATPAEPAKAPGWTPNK